MYPLGILFGLGFDTSSEIALLGISSIQATKGTSIWLILLFPVLFTVGMCLLDTTDGALMMTLYTSTALARDQIAILYYSIVLTVITVVVAMVIGVIQMLSLVVNIANPKGAFWNGVERASRHWDAVGMLRSWAYCSNMNKMRLIYTIPGGAICGSFVLFGGLSVLLYKPWRRRIDHRRGQRAQFSGVPQTLEEEASGSDFESRRDGDGGGTHGGKELAMGLK